MMMFDHGTWIEDEKLAYCTPNGGPTGSRRRVRARCSDGIARIFRAGVPDTFYTVPVIGRIKGRYVRGYVSIEHEPQGSYLIFTQERES